jgi:hypothetical protein
LGISRRCPQGQATLVPTLLKVEVNTLLQTGHANRIMSDTVKLKEGKWFLC